MGIAKSLRKAGYLNKVSQDLSVLAEYFQKQREEEEKGKVYQQLYDMYNQWKEKQNEINQEKYALKENARLTNNPFLALDKTTRLGSTIPTTLQQQIKPELLPQQVNEEPTIPQTITENISPEARYNKAKGNLYDYLNNIAPTLLNRKLGQEDLSRINILTELAKNQVQSLKPEEPTLFDLSEGQSKYMLDRKTGTIKTIATNPKDKAIEEIEKDESGNYKTYNIRGRKYYRTIKKDNSGNIIDEQLTLIPEKEISGSGSGGRDNDSKEKGLKPETAQLIANIKNYKPYFINENNEKVYKDPKDIAFDKDNLYENVKLQLLKTPRAYEFVSNIERKWRRGDNTKSRKYLTPNEIYSEALKHAKEGRISEEVQDDIATFLRYYNYDLYEALTNNESGDEK